MLLPAAQDGFADGLAPRLCPATGTVDALVNNGGNMARYRARIELLDEHRSYTVMAPKHQFTFSTRNAAIKFIERQPVKGRARGLVYPDNMLYQDRHAWDWSQVFTIAI